MKYHFIGDQGISMRGLKQYLRSLGHEVSGSDLKSGGHSAEKVTPDIDVVVRTSAVGPGSPGWVEVEAARKIGLKVIKRSELLGEITKDKRLIAVSGMHGKTTITSMIGLVLTEAGLDPTVFVGEEVKQLGGLIRLGKSPWVVVEVCEYDKSFFDVSPQIVILTNIEEEHLDTYPGGISEIKLAFGEYLRQIKRNGALIYCSDNPNILNVIKHLRRDDIDLISYGFSSAEYNHLDFDLAIPGKHNIQNALAALALSDYLQIDSMVAKKVLADFNGAHRRFELMGQYNGADIIDDYGHHPTEIKATLQALRERYPDKVRIAVFWPHQFKRIKALVKEFSQVFADIDELILKPIYFVPGRDEKLDISSQDLAEMIEKQGTKVSVMEKDQEIIEYLKQRLDHDSVLLTIGIPPVYQIGQALLKNRQSE